ncbi:MAG: transposase [Gemmatimonadetes bacterium]|nr:transposase [Gemmatimonadota bacterium]
MGLVRIVVTVFGAFVRDRSELVIENLALRQQLAVLQHKSKRPRLRKCDRVFWALLSRIWPNWRSALLLVRPDTVVRWHRQGFKLFWRWKSRFKVGRPRIDAEIRALIRRMSRENPSWGVPRIQSELVLLGHTVSEATVRKYRIRKRNPPSQTWRTFLDNHLTDIVAIDFFTVPTATFRVLFAFVVMRHDRRQVVHFNDDTAPWFLIRDRDAIYGSAFQQRIKNMGIEEVVCAPQSPWQNPYCERLVGSIRRECLDHIIVLNERHLMRILRSYFVYYHESRTHLSLNRNSPVEREVEPPERGRVVAIPQVGGLHHRYCRAA